MWLTAPGTGAEERSCLSCHQETKTNCNLQCRACHVLPGADFVPTEDHEKIVANPSGDRYWDELCGRCHGEKVAGLRRDKHYSLSGVIGRTRYLLGKEDKLQPDYAAETWKELANVNGAGRTTAQLADRLLAQKCLACHMEADGVKLAGGRKRRAGCSACHSPLDQQTGKPLNGHKFSRRVSGKTCLTCHSGNRIGADYYGYFEHDYHNEYNTPFGSQPRFGTYQHRLAADVHLQAGLDCGDCHQQHANENTRAKKTIACVICHGGFRQSAKEKYKTIKFNASGVSHQSFHQKVGCAACHAQWSYQDYGLHLFLDETNNYEMWQTYLWQGDQIITDLLESQLALPPRQRKQARTPNRLTDRLLPGAWFSGWTLRRWEGAVLGKDLQGYFRIIRPLYQFFITCVDSQEQVWLDSKIPRTADGRRGWSWDVYRPHTIGRRGRACESCHQNAMAVGKGIRFNPADSVTQPVTIPNRVIDSEGRLLNRSEQNRLLQKSSRYKIWRSRAFREQGLDRLFR